MRHEAELIVKFNCGSTDTLLEFEDNVQELYPAILYYYCAIIPTYTCHIVQGLCVCVCACVFCVL